MLLPLALAVALAAAPPIPVRHAIGALHGFPSMSVPNGNVIADGELKQEVAKDQLVVRTHWAFADGLQSEERDEFRIDQTLAQVRFLLVETRGGVEQRRFEVDFSTGQASSSIRDAKGHVDRQEVKLDLPHGRSFAGFGAALAAMQLGLHQGEKAEITFVAFTPRPRAITLQVQHEGEQAVDVAGRAIACDRYALHPVIPFPINLFAGAKDAHLWLTHEAPPGLVRAEQSLVTKDDPVIVIDVTARGRAHRAATAPRPATPPPP
jgi:hypothetical protein